jgi:hypothetical protein
MINRTVTCVLEAPRDTVFAFFAEVENLPLWATDFARTLTREDGRVRVTNGLGEFLVWFDADPQTGVIDIHAGPTEQDMALFPTRVVALGPARSAYSFTMFKQAGMPDELFESQRASLEREFANIRARFGPAACCA